MEKIIRIPLVIYPFTVLMFCDCSNEQIKGHFMGAGGDELRYILDMPNDHMGRHTIIEGCSVIRIQTDPDKYKLVGVLSHEIFHSVSVLLWKMGLRLEIGASDEAYAYLTGYITKEVFQQLGL